MLWQRRMLGIGWDKLKEAAEKRAGSRLREANMIEHKLPPKFLLNWVETTTKKNHTASLPKKADHCTKSFSAVSQINVADVNSFTDVYLHLMERIFSSSPLWASARRRWQRKTCWIIWSYFFTIYQAKHHRVVTRLLGCNALLRLQCLRWSTVALRGQMHCSSKNPQANS